MSKKERSESHMRNVKVLSSHMYGCLRVGLSSDNYCMFRIENDAGTYLDGTLIGHILYVDSLEMTRFVLSVLDDSPKKRSRK